MLTVIKKNLKTEAFDGEKIRISLANSADDISFSINQVDLDLISRDVERQIIKMRGVDGVTSCYEIKCLVIKFLLELTFRKLAKSYHRYCSTD